MHTDDLADVLTLCSAALLGHLFVNRHWCCAAFIDLRECEHKGRLSELKCALFVARHLSHILALPCFLGFCVCCAQASLADLNVVDFVFADPMLHSSGLDVSREEIVTQLTSVGFTQEMLEMVITSLSGGWKMKLALARAMLMKVSCHW
jgi:hypothetical protein